MTKLFKYITAITLSLAILGCDALAVSTPDNLYADDTFVSEAERLVIERNNITGTNFNVSANPAIATGAVVIDGTTYDELTVTFANGRVDNTAANLANITVYPLTNPTTATTAKSVAVRGTALTFASTTVTYNVNSTTIVYRIAQDTTPATTLTADGYEVVVNPAITAYGEIITLNQDGDIVAGETDDDMYIFTIDNSLTVKHRKSGAVALAAGGLSGATPTTQDILINLTTGLPTDTFSTTSLAGDLMVEQFNFTTHVWDNVAFSLAYDSDLNDDTVFDDGQITLDIPATDDRQLYRYSYKTGAIAQDSSLIDSTDYVVKAETDAEAADDYTTVTSLWTDTTDFTGSLPTVTRFNDHADKYVEVTFNGIAAGNIIPSTLTATSITFYLSGPDKFVSFDAANVVEISENTFRFYLDTVLDISSVTVTTYPTIMTDGTLPNDATDDLYFGTTANNGSFIN